jgi:hypothetical protein
VDNKHSLNIGRWNLRLRSAGVLRILALALLLLPSCSLVPSIAVVKDEPIESLVRNEAGHILAVTADATNTSQYQIFLSDFPRADILGMSIGRFTIVITFGFSGKPWRMRLHMRSRAMPTIFR